jgi:hypothetical protein
MLLPADVKNKGTGMNGKRLLLAAAAGIVLLLVGFVSKQTNNSSFDAAKEMIVMRQIAHKILQYAGDSTTQVSPVNRISSTAFQIPFQSSFSFKPDSLVQIIDRIIRSNQLPADYIVQVTEPKSNKVIFGYAILNNGQQNIVPCRGRNQPAVPYSIQITFKDKPFAAGSWLIAAGVALLGLVAFMAWRIKRKPVITDNGKQDETTSAANSFSIGTYLFYADSQRLVYNNEEIILTSKEAKLLRIFAEAPNQIIDRNRLQKEVWEDEGVIVGRSLDVFVSKLRKRLEQDPAIKIVSIHGKGYKLEIG